MKITMPPVKEKTVKLKFHKELLPDYEMRDKWYSYNMGPKLSPITIYCDPYGQCIFFNGENMYVATTFSEDVTEIAPINEIILK